MMDTKDMCGAVALSMAVHTGQSLDELGEHLLHMHKRGWVRFGCDADGDLCFQMRTDRTARIAALLDDHAQARRN